MYTLTKFDGDTLRGIHGIIAFMDIEGMSESQLEMRGRFEGLLDRLGVIGDVMDDIQENQTLNITTGV